MKFERGMDSFEPDELRVFVYGTLMPGGRYHREYCGNYLTNAIPAAVRGQLYDFPQMGYPAMTAGHDWVKGYLLEFCQSAATCEDILRRLDALEGYVSDAVTPDGDYQRRQAQIFTPEYETLQMAWVYQMSAEQVCKQGGVYLPGGDWRSRLSAKFTDTGADTEAS